MLNRRNDEETTLSRGELTSEPGNVALYVEGLTKTFGNGDNAVKAVDDISFAVEPGKIVGLLGPNGAGKTTTIKSILQLVHAEEGTIYIDGINVGKNPKEAFNEVSLMLEGARNDYWRLTAKENLRYFSALKGENIQQSTQKHNQLLEQLDLTEKANNQVRDLSRGMKQKVSLASALVGEVSVAFLDEPTLGLDVKSALTLRQELTRIAKDGNISVILCSHDMDIIEDVCDRVIIISDGQIIADDDVEMLTKRFKKQGYQIEVKNTTCESLSMLRSRYPIKEVEEYNSRVRFDLTADNETFYELLNDIRTSELTLQSVETIQPDLEDIFLELISGVNQ